MREAATRGEAVTLTIEPFHDPGEPIRAQSLSEFQSAKAALRSSAQSCAAEVRSGCSAAHPRRNWLETGLSFLGEVVYGAGEAVYQLGKMLVDLQYGPINDLLKLASGELTPEELAMKNQLKVEQAQALWTAFTTDPVGFGKQLGKAVLDWDTWADNPGRALGHLVPDIVAAIFTGGAATAATRGGRAAQMTMRVLSDLSGANLLRGAIKPLTSGQWIRHVDDIDLGRWVESAADIQGARYLRPSQETTDLLLSDVAAVGRSDIAGYVGRMNPLLEVGGEWANNCGPCSRAFADIFQGVETRVAPGDVLQGEGWEMRAATSTNPTPLHFDPALDIDTSAFSSRAYSAVSDAAKTLPDGSALIVGVDWAGPGGHWFNAVVDGGELKWVDAQIGEVGGWPPGYGSSIRTIDVVHRPDGSSPWKELDL